MTVPSIADAFPPHVLREYALIADGERGALIEYDVPQRQLRGNLPQAFVHALMLECSARPAGSPAPDDPAIGQSRPVTDWGGGARRGPLRRPTASRQPAHEPGRQGRAKGHEADGCRYRGERRDRAGHRRLCLTGGTQVARIAPEDLIERRGGPGRGCERLPAASVGAARPSSLPFWPARSG